MSANGHHDISARLGRLVAEIEAAKRRPRRRRGRPDTGIRRDCVRVETYLSPGIVAGLDRLADRTEQQTGKSTRRSDIVRAALRAYLRQRLPDSGL